MNRKILASPYIVWALGFIILPLFMIVYYGLTDGSDMFTLENVLAIADSVHYKAFGNSLLLALGSTVICLVIAYPLAYILSQHRGKAAQMIIMLFILPMWINFTLRITALKEILTVIEGNLSLHPFLNTVIGMTYDYLPFMILPLYTTLLQLDQNLLEAAQDLGAGPASVFTRVTLPLSMPGIVSGITMTFLPAMTNYVILDMMYNSTYIMGSLIGSYFNIYDWNNGSMISLILFAVICIVSIITGGEDQDDAKNRGAVL